ncbi:FHA domain-containing protein [Leucobacter weissii]|uniref:FHA domain-containing protein n=2 Tax=Leucobacter weissii TaxID=1983706 RepID=A0A939SCV5_9MICO|nr:FHA domain-containing protein [Leucobacter weissii]
MGTEEMSMYYGLLIAMAAIPLILALALVIWMLWALGRLFPRLGLRAGEGWIPFWNHWRVLERGGFPGWIAVPFFAQFLFAIVSSALRATSGDSVNLGALGIELLIGLVLGALTLASTVFLFIAVHRINAEAGVGGGFTVLAVFLYPLWATLLANRIGGRVLGRPGPGGALPGGYGPGVATTAPPAPPFPQAPEQRFAPPAQHPAPSQFGHGTDAEYARLAAEPFTAPPAAPLGDRAPAEPFSWTAGAAAEEAPVQVPPPPAPPIHPSAVPFGAPSQAAPQDPGSRLPPAPPVPPAPQPQWQSPPRASDEGFPSYDRNEPLPTLPVEPLPPAQAASEPVPAPPASGATSAPPSREAPTGPSPWAPPSADAEPPEERTPPPSPARAHRRSTGITGVFGASPGPARTGAAGRAESDDPEDLDRTIVAPRRGRARWALVLPDGSSHPLAGSDVVVGRRPAPLEGSAALEIPDPARNLSKSHARLRLDGERWTVEDLGSTNGLALLHSDGRQEELAPHRPVPATERMMFGTLEVRLLPESGVA